jgi:hypothetical protein
MEKIKLQSAPVVWRLRRIDNCPQPGAAHLLTNVSGQGEALALGPTLDGQTRTLIALSPFIVCVMLILGLLLL